MFDFDADRRRNAGLAAFNPFAEPKASPQASPDVKIRRLIKELFDLGVKVTTIEPTAPRSLLLPSELRTPTHPLAKTHPAAPLNDILQLEAAMRLSQRSVDVGHAWHLEDGQTYTSLPAEAWKEVNRLV